VNPITPAAPGFPGRAILQQSWTDLVFVHWRADPAEIAPLLPAGVLPDEFDGSTWVGLIPFEMRATSVLGSPAIPYFGSFTEINVRLYGVDHDGRRGVVFRSLEASRLAAVVAANLGFSLPYRWASARSSSSSGRLTYSSRRMSRLHPSTRVSVTSGTAPVTADPLSDFLTARWLLFVSRAGRTIALPNEHAPWALFEAELEELDDELVAAAGIRSVAGRAPDSVFYSPGVVSRFGRPLR
jgi:uncharacterized protein YqjF (DUF2071 family)